MGFGIAAGECAPSEIRFLDPNQLVWLVIKLRSLVAKERRRKNLRRSRRGFCLAAKLLHPWPLETDEIISRTALAAVVCLRTGANTLWHSLCKF